MRKAERAECKNERGTYYFFSPCIELPAIAFRVEELGFISDCSTARVVEKGREFARGVLLEGEQVVAIRFDGDPCGGDPPRAVRLSDYTDCSIAFRYAD